MNAAQIHLALNHAPLFFSLCGGLILLAGMIRKHPFTQQLGLYLLVAAALFTIPVFLTGEGTEELVENIPGVAENAIEAHEDWAKITLGILSATGLIALAGLIAVKKAGLRRALLFAAVVLSLASFGAMAQTAHLGGLIRHTELGQPGTGTEAKGNEEEEEDKPTTGKKPEDPAVVDSPKARQPELRRKDDDD